MIKLKYFIIALCGQMGPHVMYHYYVQDSWPVVLHVEYGIGILQHGSVCTASQDTLIPLKDVLSIFARQLWFSVSCTLAQMIAFHLLSFVHYYRQRWCSLWCKLWAYSVCDTSMIPQHSVQDLPRRPPFCSKSREYNVLLHAVYIPASCITASLE